MSRTQSSALCAVAVLITAASPARALQQDSIATHVTLPVYDGRAVIEPDSLDRTAFTNVAELLQARVPGLSVTRRGDGSTRLHLRGPTSVYADNSPLLIVDGVRIALERSQLPEFAGRPSPLDDIDVEQIERIEVFSGPAVAALYGTGAANGVIMISTRDARATPTRWRIFAAGGGLGEPKPYPANFSRSGTTSSGSVTTTCTRVFEASGGCTPTGVVTSFNPLEEEGIVGVASLARIGGSVASGSELLAWSGGATFEREGSVIDAFARQRVHVRGAARAQLASNAELSLRGHWMEGATPVTASDFPIRGQALLDFRTPDQWRGFLPGPEPERDVSRRGLSLVAEWRATPWLRGTVVTGLDHSSGRDGYTFTSSVGDRTYTSREYVRQRRNDFTGRVDVEATYNLGGTLRARTTGLVDVVEHRRTDRFEAGALTSDGLSLGSFVQARSDQDIVGLAIEQEISGRWAALRLALRHDDLGSNWKSPWYPHASLVWVAATDTVGVVGGLRFRAAYGKAGALPSPEPVIFAPIVPPWGEPVDAKPEVTTEGEVGFDATLLNRHADLSVSWYSKQATDVLMLFGGGLGFGEVMNGGVEGSLRAHLIRASRTSWNVRIGFARNRNEVTNAGSPAILASRQWILERAPLAGYRRHPIASAVDTDGDGVLESSCFSYDSQSCEVRYAEQPQYLAAFPPTEVSLENSLRRGPLTLSFLIDHRRGHYLHNLTELYRCSYGRCSDAYATSLAHDAAIRQASIGGGNYFASGAFVEKATFTKLRELSVRIDAPAAWARSLGGNRLELSLAGRNLATWTDYTGMDPEASSYGDDDLTVGDLASTPLPRSIALRVTLTK